jgi:hypothetical protein
MDTDPDQSNKYLVEKKKLSKKRQSRYKYGSNTGGIVGPRSHDLT